MVRRSLFLINLVNFIDGIAYFGILGLLTLYLTDILKFSDPQAGVLVSLFTGIVSFSMVFLGGVSDRLGIRNGLHLSLILTVIGRGMLAYCPELPQSQLVAIGALLLMGFAQGIMQPALYAGIKEYSLQGGASMGYSWLYAVMNLGIVAESFFSPYIRTSAPFLGMPGLGLGIAGVYKVMFALTALLTVVNGLLFTKKLEQQQWNAPVRNEEDTGPSPLREPRFLYFIFILLPVRTLFAHQFMTMPQYIARCFSQEVVDKLEWFNLINPLVVFVCTPLFAAVFSKTHVLKVMIGGTFLSAVTTFLLVSEPDVAMLILYNVVFSMGESLWASRFLEFIAELAPPGRVGAYMGVGYVPWAFAKFATGFYSGKMIETYIPPSPQEQDPSTLWLAYGLFACISPLGLFLARRWLREVERPAEGNS